jgi:hypothetical protein
MDADAAHRLGKDDVLLFAKAGDVLPAPLAEHDNLSPVRRETVAEHRRTAIGGIHGNSNVER